MPEQPEATHDLFYFVLKDNSKQGGKKMGQGPLTVLVVRDLAERADREGGGTVSRNSVWFSAIGEKLEKELARPLLSDDIRNMLIETIAEWLLSIKSISAGNSRILDLQAQSRNYMDPLIASYLGAWLGARYRDYLEVEDLKKTPASARASAAQFAKFVLDESFSGLRTLQREYPAFLNVLKTDASLISQLGNYQIQYRFERDNFAQFVSDLHASASVPPQNKYPPIANKLTRDIVKELRQIAVYDTSIDVALESLYGVLQHIENTSLPVTDEIRAVSRYIDLKIAEKIRNLYLAELKQKSYSALDLAEKVNKVEQLTNTVLQRFSRLVDLPQYKDQFLVFYLLPDRITSLLRHYLLTAMLR